MSKKIEIGSVEVELIGKPFVISVDTFSHDDYFEDYFNTNKEAIKHTESTGGVMLKKHAYDRDGVHIGEGGTF